MSQDEEEKTPLSFLKPLTQNAFKASWVGRLDGIKVDDGADRETMIQRLYSFHLSEVQKMGKPSSCFWRCEQTHSHQVQRVSGMANHAITPIVDGLITNDPEVTLGIYVADCGAIYLADPINQAIGLLHSGKAGTEKNILAQGVQQMEEAFGSNPSELVVLLSPCIRPPVYEIDFAATISQQAAAIGILPQNFHDAGICTSQDPDLYYSYRIEKGKTGRMLALLSL